MIKYYKNLKKSKKGSGKKPRLQAFSIHYFALFQKVVNNLQCFWHFKKVQSLIIKQLQGCFLYIGYFVDGGIVLSKNKIILLKISKSISSV